MGVSQRKGKNVQVTEKSKCEDLEVREKMVHIFGKPKTVHFVVRGGWLEINLERQTGPKVKGSHQKDSAPWGIM